MHERCFHRGGPSLWKHLTDTARMGVSHLSGSELSGSERLHYGHEEAESCCTMCLSEAPCAD